MVAGENPKNLRNPINFRRFNRPNASNITKYLFERRFLQNKNQTENALSLQSQYPPELTVEELQKMKFKVIGSNYYFKRIPFYPGKVVYQKNSDKVYKRII